MFSLKYQVFASRSKRYKTQQLDKQLLPNSIHAVQDFHNDVCIEELVATLLLILSFAS